MTSLNTPMKRKPKVVEAVSQEWLDHVDELFQEVFSFAPGSPKEYVYLTQADFGYKIGRTTNPTVRPMAVAGNCPIKLTVLAVIEVPDSRAAEKRLHAQFASKRIGRGEWFALDSTDVELIRGFPKSFDGLTNPGDVPL